MFDNKTGKTEIIDTKKTLILTVGLPYSGKSTWAMRQDWPVVNPDSIRVALYGERFNALMEPYVWAIANTMVKSLFMAGYDTVILDATNTTEKRRKEWAYGGWQLRCKVFFADHLECEHRARVDGDTEIIPIISRMAYEFEPVEDDSLLLPEINDIVGVISKHVELKPKGKVFLGCCPFHKEKTPSFVVDPLKHEFTCLGCGAKGSVIDFIERIKEI